MICPIYKNGSTTDKTNYRPISLINNFAKVFEKALKIRLQEFLDKYNIISQNQYGFRTKLSTNDAIYKLTNIINRTLHEGRKCITVFLDLAKAFDTVSHSKLIQKLEYIGIRGKVLDVFVSYLTNRTQYVKIGDTLSSVEIVKAGIPQGTIVAPLIFLIYVNNLCNIHINGQLISYADDTAIVVTGDSWEEVEVGALQDMETILAWLDYNLLSFNATKTKFMTFSIYDSHQPNINELKLGKNQTVKKIDKIKYLGIIIDKNLKWMEHVTYITSKIRKMIHKFYGLRYILSRKSLILIYEALVVSTIKYGIIAWGGAYQNSLLPLVNIQKHIVKIIFKKQKIYPSSDLFILYRNHNILNINDIYITECIVFVRQHLNMFDFVSHSYSTRAINNQHLNIETYLKNKQQHYIDYLGPYYYNRIPRVIRDIKNHNTFRKQIITYVLHMDTYKK